MRPPRASLFQPTAYYSTSEDAMPTHLHTIVTCCCVIGCQRATNPCGCLPLVPRAIADSLSLFRFQNELGNYIYTRNAFHQSRFKHNHYNDMFSQRFNTRYHVPGTHGSSTGPTPLQCRTVFHTLVPRSFADLRFGKCADACKTTARVCP